MPTPSPAKAIPSATATPSAGISSSGSRPPITATTTPPISRRPSTSSRWGAMTTPWPSWSEWGRRIGTPGGTISRVLPTPVSATRFSPCSSCSGRFRWSRATWNTRWPSSAFSRAGSIIRTSIWSSAPAAPPPDCAACISCVPASLSAAPAAGAGAALGQAPPPRSPRHG